MNDDDDYDDDDDADDEEEDEDDDEEEEDNLFRALKIMILWCYCSLENAIFHQSRLVQLIAVTRANIDSGHVAI